METINKSFILLGILGLGIITALLIIPTFGADTIIINSGSSSSSNALANLTDVSIIDAKNKQILVYNSTTTKWQNKNQTSISVTNSTCANLGSGKILCASYSNNNLNFKSLLSGLGISLTNDTNTVTITNTLPENTVCNNSTSSAGHLGLCKTDIIALRTLFAGSGISLSLNSTDITITNNGVISMTASSPLSASASTGTITISCSTCVTTTSNPMTLLCQNTLGSSATSISCSSFTAKKHLFIEANIRTITGSMTYGLRFNSDSGSNYAYGSSVSQTQIELCNSSNCSFPDDILHTCHVLNNLSGDRKLLTCATVIGGALDAGTAPTFITLGGKWSNTSAQITSISIVRTSGTGSMNTNSNVSVWGYD